MTSDKLKLITLVIAILLVIFFTLNLALELTKLPFVCGGCHQMRNFYLSWQEAPHRKQTCVDCHAGEGVAGLAYHFIDTGVSFTGWIRSYLTGEVKKPLVDFIPDIWCLKCHQQVLKKTVASKHKKIRMSHKEPHKAGYKCIDCHSETAHPKATAYPTTPKMEECFTCHKSGQGSTYCRKCHLENVKGEKPRRTHRGKWRQITHQLWGFNNKVICQPCHGKKPCLSCHNLELPHPKNFLTTHGELVLDKKVDCKQCHKNDFCFNCHQLEMPHASNWNLNHANFVQEKTDQVCKKCHLSRECKDCHDKHPIHP
jgi:hypothetical protein